MELGHLVLFNVTLIAALISPGPALLLSLKTTLSQGRLAGIATGLGLATMAALWTAAALLGLEAIFTLVPWAYVTMRLFGAAYLLWIAYGMWRSAADRLAETSANAPKLRRAFWAGMGVNLANPKSVLFAASVLVVIFPAGLSLSAKALIVANHFAVECIAYTAFAAALSTSPARAGYLRAKPVIDRASALILGALGFRLIFSK